MFSDDFDRPSTPPVEIPASSVSAEALDGIIESFVTREGTDYGSAEMSHDSKVGRVRNQLERGDIMIVFDPDSESVTLMTKMDWVKLQKS